MEELGSFCKDVIDKPLHYDCTIYNDFTGDIGSQGRFILRGYTWNEEKKRATYHVVEPLKVTIVSLLRWRKDISQRVADLVA